MQGVASKFDVTPKNMTPKNRKLCVTSSCLNLAQTLLLMTLEPLTDVQKTVKAPPNGDRKLHAVYIDILILADLPEPCQILSDKPWDLDDAYKIVG